MSGALRREGREIPIPKGMLYLALARAGWKGEDGLLSADFVRRLRGLDPRLAHLYLPLDLDAAA